VSACAHTRRNRDARPPAGSPPRRRTLRQRIAAAARQRACWLWPATAAATACSSLCFFALQQFTSGALPLPSFPVRDARGAQYATLALGVLCAAGGAAVWRAAVAAQPAALHMRALLSAPDAKGDRAPLFTLAPPPAALSRGRAAALARAVGRRARLQAAEERAASRARAATGP
jgi:hypothetical protein